MPMLVTRCSDNDGPFPFLEKLVPLAIQKALAHEPMRVYGDGLNVRDWLFVEDHCRAIDMVLSRGRPGQVYNIGGKNERSNISVVKRIIEECSAATDDKAINDQLVSYVEDRKGHDRRYGIAADKIQEEIGWRPEVDFEDGIVRTVRWYLDNPEWLERAVLEECQSV